MSERCKEPVPKDNGFGYRKCIRLAIRDGYCKEHLPHVVAAARLRDRKAALFDELVAAVTLSLNWLASYPGGGAKNAWEEVRAVLDKAREIDHA